MSKYSELSDFEVNKLVAEREGIDSIFQFEQVVVSDGVFGRAVDYCNNWADAGPLMVESGISLNRIHAKNDWQARHFFGDKATLHARSDNPCRAIAECYLMMTEESPE